LKGKNTLKPINLLSLLNANRKLTPEVFKSYIHHFDIKIKNSELEDLRSLVKKLLDNIKEVNILEKFYVGYTINQIGKEFDLLRFGNNNIINIELKKEDTGDRIKKQLIKNKYYLGFLDKKVLNFTYVAEEKKLFYLDESEKLTEVKISFLISELLEQKLIEIEDIHKLFDSSNYLVSPFNSTEKFINNKYFLTDHQENIKKGIFKLNRETEPCFISIEGNAGTGKTLLIYDIAKEYRNRSERVLIFHCGALNNGHIKLKSNYSWKITQSHNHKNYNLNDYGLIILDETQRIDMDEIDEILLKAKETNAVYIFSYDFQQCLASWEIKRNIPQYIKEQVSPKHFKLTEKIRTNQEIASFIKNLFNLRSRNPNQEYPNIDVSYFTTSLGVIKEMEMLKSQGWKIINFTPTRYSSNPYDEFHIGGDESSHQIIGQEFDKVVAVLDKHFFYGQDSKLSTQGWRTEPYYHPTKMLFQMVTRARKQLHLIIFNNEAILKECLNILNSGKR
jgi:hypothetical protein